MDGLISIIVWVIAVLVAIMIGKAVLKMWKPEKASKGKTSWNNIGRIIVAIAAALIGFGLASYLVNMIAEQITGSMPNQVTDSNGSTTTTTATA